MGSVISLGWKIYDWAVLTGESQPSQNSLARITFELLMFILSKMGLVAVGSEPSVV